MLIFGVSRTLNRTLSRGLAAAALLTAHMSVTGAAAGEALVNVFATQGCAIGPSTYALARAEGFEARAVDALVEQAGKDPETVRTGDWLVLSRAACTIRPPHVKSKLTLDDPEIRKRITVVNEHAGEGSPGCFLNNDGLSQELMITRNWLPGRLWSYMIACREKRRDRAPS
ncbi:hypothetical protein ACWGNA_24625 [Brucella cytisi]|uniref:hypothetical protein n=1 Tax=Brucella cytisi TaxID=407152 RepID=UPI0035E0644F